jgi:hypothetical protein
MATRVTEQVPVNIGEKRLEHYRRTATLNLTNVVGYPRLALVFQTDPSPQQGNGRPRTAGGVIQRYVGRCKGYVNKRCVGKFLLVQSQDETFLQVLD